MAHANSIPKPSTPDKKKVILFSNDVTYYHYWSPVIDSITRDVRVTAECCTLYADLSRRSAPRWSWPSKLPLNHLDQPLKLSPTSLPSSAKLPRTRVLLLAEK